MKLTDNERALYQLGASAMKSEMMTILIDIAPKMPIGTLTELKDRVMSLNAPELGIE